MAISPQNTDAAAELPNALEQGMRQLQGEPLSASMVPNQIPNILQRIVPPCRIIYRIADQSLFIDCVLRCEQNQEKSQFEGL